ncbi:MAG: hypothetical protein ACOCVF_02115 [bacterium]
MIKADKIDELEKEVHKLKMLHDYDYAIKYKTKQLLDTYQELVNTPEWYQAIKAWLNRKIDRIVDNLWWKFKMDHPTPITYNPLYPFLIGYKGGELTAITNGTDIFITCEDGNQIKLNTAISSIHKEPEVEGYEFEKFVIEYCNSKI